MSLIFRGVWLASCASTDRCCERGGCLLHPVRLSVSAIFFLFWMFYTHKYPYNLMAHVFESVLLCTRRLHGRRIMNLFRKLKSCCTCSNSTSLPTSHPRNKATVKPPPVQTSPAHPSNAQQFLSVNVSNRAAQCKISWPATFRKQQRDSHA